MGVFGGAEGANDCGEERGGEQPGWNPPALLLHDEEDGRQVPEAGQSHTLPPQLTSPLLTSPPLFPPLLQAHCHPRLLLLLSTVSPPTPNHPHPTPTQEDERGKPDRPQSHSCRLLRG